MDKSAIPADYETLRELYTTQQAQMTQLQDFVQSLLEQIRLSRHQHFGARSEAFNVDQLSLLTADDITTSSGSDNVESNDPTKDDDGIDVPSHRRVAVVR